MRGGDDRTEGLFSYVSCEARVPATHPLLSTVTLAGLAADVLDRPLRNILGSFCSISHRSLLNDDDEPITLSYAITLICSIGPDGGQTCEDTDKLRILMRNARNNNNEAVANAAFKRLISLVPSYQPGTVEHDFWQTVHAFEEVLTEERGKTTRLTRTRQKVNRVGVVQTLKDWALSKKETDGFNMLLDRRLPELTGEAIVLRHPEHFDEEVRTAAQRRLSDACVDVRWSHLFGQSDGLSKVYSAV